MQRLEKLMELLKNNHKYHVTYKNGFSNHLSMDLIALYFLNADEKKLQDIYDKYTPHLEHLVHSDFEITGINWNKHLGTNQYFWSYYKFFRAKKSILGIEEVLHNYLPQLIKGIAGGLFHPLIRLAYSLELWNYANSQDNQHLATLAEDEVVIALAYFADSYLELPIYGDQNKKLSSLLNQLISEKNHSSKTSGILTRIKHIANTNSAYKALSNNIENTPDDLTTLANSISEVYIDYQDFTLLHCVTSLHAFRVVFDFAPHNLAITHYWHAFMAAFLSVDKTLSANNHPTDNYIAPDEIEEKAISLTDSHDIKLLYTVASEYEFYKNPNYQKIISLIKVK